MPAFMFEKISPPSEGEPVPRIAKKPRGVIVAILDRFVESRTQRSEPVEQGVTTRQMPE